jgi:Zn finger protein HypA/HybF involved in hydrogenase expression
MKNKTTTHIQFICPKDGEVEREDVDVWCNRCSRGKTIQKDGLYLCPDCFSGKEGCFSCRICNSNKVQMKEVAE